MKSKILKLLGCLLSIILFSMQAKAQYKAWVAPKDSSNFSNPLPVNQSTVDEGRKIYQARCVVCHGESGRGDGKSSATLEPRPTNFLSAETRNEKDWALFWKMSEGRSPMPAYKTKLTKTQRWQLVAYIRKLEEQK